ncbi:spore coat protein [Aciduricibacillus chroicocephali]|uniref:Spore coat protein n=1 Tax=Aciduricibacillus chroicocephali TaxID=3054939 RepID=A0ABY9KWF3_9BACI|nr:spore coat protein [Bacillaceae bacterium 44XB]
MLNQNQNQQQNMTTSHQVPNQFMHAGHEMFDAHEAIRTIAGGLEQCLMYEQHVQDPELKGIMQRQKAFNSQLYNTMIETLKTGQKPSVSTQVYNMDQGTNNLTIYGTKPAQPKPPAASVQDISDKCIAGFVLGNLKTAASCCTMAALEATNPVMRRVFADSVPNLIEEAYEVFLYSNKKGYYQVPQLKDEDMQNMMSGFAPIQTTTH